jgi:adenine-specific DNA-methyltransferase
MDKLKLHSPDFTQANIERLAELFPNCVTEKESEEGNGKGEIRRALDFDLLRQELSGHIVEGPQERYQLNWPGKREALLTANAPIAKTLRPCREESVEFDTTQNLFIEGDNLDALKLLQETYLGKVKMIYIDPPYNTGNDFIYEDDFAEDTENYKLRSNQKDEAGNRLVANTETNGRFHSDWLSMMYPRLKLARNLLRDDGVIFISIDDNEQANLKRLCDEIFGEGNFIANIVWQKKYAPQNDATYFSDMHDHILVYAKQAKQTKNDTLGCSLDLLPRSESQNAAYTNRDNDPRGVWKAGDLSVKTYSAKNDYPITNPAGRVIRPPNSRCWAVNQERFEELVADNRIWFGEDGNNVPSLKRFLSEVQEGSVPVTWWAYQDCGHNQDAKKELKALLHDVETFFDTPKPVKLIKRMLQLASKKNNDVIILDFFSGSSTTAHSVLELNQEDNGKRKFILVQLPEPTNNPKYPTIAEIGKERIRRAGQKILKEMAVAHVDKTFVGEALASTTGPSLQVEAKASPTSTHTSTSTPAIDIGFRVLKIDSSNMKDVYYTPDQLKQGDLEQFTDNIKDDRSAEDLLFQVLLDWGVDLSLPIVREEWKGEWRKVKSEGKDEIHSSPFTLQSSLTVFFVDGNALAACFDTDINEAFVKQLAARHPLRVVFRDAGFVSDSVKINIGQIFKLLSPNTEIKTI